MGTRCSQLRPVLLHKLDFASSSSTTATVKQPSWDRERVPTTADLLPNLVLVLVQVQLLVMVLVLALPSLGVVLDVVGSRSRPPGQQNNLLMSAVFQ